MQTAKEGKVMNLRLSLLRKTKQIRSKVGPQISFYVITYFG